MTSYRETENLILAIRKRRGIWDRTADEYKNKALKQDAWIDVCMAVREDYNDADDELKKQILNDLQIRWKSIRDANIRSHKKMTGKSQSGASSTKKYVFADLLKFLQKTSTDDETDNSDETLQLHSQNQNESSSQDAQEEEELELLLEVEAEPLSLSPGSITTPEQANCPSSIQQNNTSTRKRSRKANIEVAGIEFLDRRNDEADSDKSFFNSLLPFVRNLTEGQKLEFRSQVITLLQGIKSTGYENGWGNVKANGGQTS